MKAEDVISEINRYKDPKKAEILQRFFKTGRGEYGEGDIFLGLNVPKQREIVSLFRDLSFSEVQKLLKTTVHEYRQVALLILVQKYKSEPKRVFDLYLKNRKHINNWDLVDLTAPNIVGDYLLERDRKVIYTLAKSEVLWDRRIAIVSTLTFIRRGEFEDTLKLASLLLGDKQDLIHKATGWMIREVGKRDQKVLERFLDKNCSKMPRTMLRYSIEKFSPKKRKFYLSCKK